MNSNRDKKTLFICCSIFFITMLVFITANALNGIYPFGERSNLLWDEDLQYIDYFQFYRNVLLGKENLSYTFSKSLGGSTIALFSYYLASPLNLLIVFFDPAQMPFFLYLITAIKLGLCSITMYYFERKRFPALPYIESVGLSVAYGLMQYNFLQSSNIMWLDGVILMPVIMYFIYEFVTSSRKRGLFISVALSILMNWYTGYMVCLFSGFYYLYELMIYRASHKGCSIKGTISSCIQYLITMFLGIGASAILFYPAVKGLQNGKDVYDAAIFNPGFHGRFLDIFHGFTLGSYSGNVSLYCGTIFLIFVLYYFFCHTVHLKEKIISISLLLFLLCSCWFIPLDCIWSGFRFVGSYLYRYSFVIIFFILFLSTKGLLAYHEERNYKKIVLLTVVYLAFLVFFQITGEYSLLRFIFTFTIIITWPAILLFVKKKRLKFILSGLLLISELLLNGILTLESVYATNFFHNRIDEFKNYVLKEHQQIEGLKEYDKSPFYRTEVKEKRYNTSTAYLNESLAFGYNGISHYSSTYDSELSDFLFDAGYSGVREATVFSESILPLDSLVGLKYVLSNENIPGYEVLDMPIKHAGKTIYKNPYALGLGIVASDNILNKITAADPFDYQNQMYSNLLGRPVEIYSKIEITSEVHDGVLYFKLPEQEYSTHIYGCVNSCIEDLNLFIDGEFKGKYANWYNYRVFSVGNSETGHTVAFSNYNDIENNADGYFYSLNKDIFDYTIRELKKSDVQLIDFENTHIIASYNAEKQGEILFTIPYDKNWSVFVNGTKVKQERGLNIFTAVPVPPGNNTIEFKYHVEGAMTGLIITICSILIFILFDLYTAKHKSQINNTIKNYPSPLRRWSNSL